MGVEDIEASVGINDRSERSDSKITISQSERRKVKGVQGKIARCVRSNYFEVVMAVVIAMNSAFIGIDQTFRLEGRATGWSDILDHVFLSIYTVELGLRLAAFQQHCLQDVWVRFDVVLVISGALTQWILPPFTGSIEESSFVVILRTLRLLRLAKAVRLLRLAKVVRMHTLWSLVRGLVHSLSTIAYTVALLVMILYMFACGAVELITYHKMGPHGEEPNQDFVTVVQDKFASLPITMLTLIQFVIFDNVVLIYDPLVRQDPSLIIYFALLILVVGIVLMNLVTAEVVNSALEAASKDKDMQAAIEAKSRKRLIKDLRKIFVELDDDKSGLVSREEIGNINPKDSMMLTEIMQVNDPVDVFDALDVDGSGEISIDEFIDGIWSVAINKSSIEVQKITRQVDKLRSDLASAKDDRDSLRQSISEIQLGINKLLSRTVQTSEEGQPTNGDAPVLTPPHVATPPPPAQCAEFEEAPAWAKTLLKEMQNDSNQLEHSLRATVGQAFEDVLAGAKFVELQETPGCNREATDGSMSQPAPTPASASARAPIRTAADTTTAAETHNTNRVVLLSLSGAATAKKADRVSKLRVRGPRDPSPPSLRPSIRDNDHAEGPPPPPSNDVRVSTTPK